MNLIDTFDQPTIGGVDYINSVVKGDNLSEMLNLALEEAHVTSTRAMLSSRLDEGAVTDLTDKDTFKVRNETEASAIADTISSTLSKWYLGDVLELGAGVAAQQNSTLVNIAIENHVGFQKGDFSRNMIGSTWDSQGFGQQSQNWTGTFQRTMQQKQFSVLADSQTRANLGNHINGTGFLGGRQINNPAAVSARDMYSLARNSIRGNPVDDMAARYDFIGPATQ